MTTLAEVLRSGVRLDWRDPEKPVFVVPPARRTAVAALLTPEAKPQTRHLLSLVAEYRAVCLALFALNAQGEHADPAQARAAMQEEYRLVDCLGVDLADLIRARVAADYTAEAHVCPMCGGPEHDA